MNNEQDLGDASTSVGEFGLLLCTDGVDMPPPFVHDNNPNLNPDGAPNYEDLPIPHFDYPTQPAPIESSYGSFPEDVLLGVDNIFLDRYIVIVGNVYRISEDGIIQLHQELSPPAQIPITPNPVQPNSGFQVGVLPFYIDELGQLYSIREERNGIKFEPKPVFNTEEEARASLGIGGAPISAPEHNLLPETLPAAPFDSILDPNFDEIFDAFIQGFTPPLSPATHGPCTPESTAEPNTPGEQPPFSGPGSGILTDGIGHPDHSPPPMTAPPLLPPSSLGETEVNKHVTSLKVQRRRRGARSSPIAIQCPECGTICRRPHVLSVS
ncbi:hypothetical protein FS749_011685 [Ceratobasidium sp. UAMH 11750]|nr:hypothetical protein FS749_011685 [Ceratobasidium sp. UAMH 11750]